MEWKINWLEINRWLYIFSVLFWYFWCVGKVELGFAYTAKAHSDGNHRLPPPPNAFGLDNMGRVLYEIKKFMKDDAKSFDGGAPMVFAYADPYACEDNQLDVLKSFMQQFAQNGDNSGGIDIYPLTRLFYTLKKELAARGRGDDVPNESFCNVFLSRDPYETIAGISCQVISIDSKRISKAKFHNSIIYFQYHETVDATRHCALSRVSRWSFLLADHFCEHLGVELIPGIHLPKNADVPFSALCGSECDTESVVSQSIRLFIFLIPRTTNWIVWIHSSFFHLNSRQAKRRTTLKAMENHHVAPFRTVNWSRRMERAESVRPAQLHQCLNSMMTCNRFAQLQLLRMVPIVERFDHLVHRSSLPALCHHKTQAHSTIHNFIHQQDTPTWSKSTHPNVSILFLKNILHQWRCIDRTFEVNRFNLPLMGPFQNLKNDIRTIIMKYLNEFQ